MPLSRPIVSPVVRPVASSVVGIGGGLSTYPCATFVPANAEYAEFTAPSEVSVSNDYTLGGWFLINDSSSTQVLFGVSQGSSDRNGIGIKSGRISAGYYDGSYTKKTWAIPETGVWYHVAITVDTGTLKFYVDGVEITDTGGSSPSLPSAAGGDIGGGFSSFYFDGSSADLRIYSNALTADQITHWKTNGRSGSDPSSENLVRHFKANDDTGFALADSSGNSGDATLTGVVTDLWPVKQSVYSGGNPHGLARVPTLYATVGGDGDGSKDDPYDLQDALDNATTNDVIAVLSGTHEGYFDSRESDIVIIGQTDRNGTPLATLVPPAVSITWSEAFDVGPNVYKTNDIPDADVLSFDGNYIFKIGSHELDVDDWGWDWLASSIPWNISATGSGDRPLVAEIDLWSLCYSVWGRTSGGTSYIRFKDGRDPNDVDIRVGEDGLLDNSGIQIYYTGPDNTEVYDLNIQGYEHGVLVRGGCDSTKVDRCVFKSCMQNVTVYAGPTNSTVSNNDITLNLHGAHNQMGWGNLTTTEAAYAEALYELFKYVTFTSSSTQRGIDLVNPGAGTVIEGNTIYQVLGGVNCGWTTGSSITDQTIRDNSLSGMSSLGIYFNRGINDSRVHGNSIVECNSNIRIGDLQDDREIELFFFDNTLDNPAGGGQHIKPHWVAGETPPTASVDIFVYHNSFSGGTYGIQYASLGDPYDGLLGWHFLNNVFSPGSETWISVIGDDLVGTFDYNWVGGSNADQNEPENWWGANNIVDDDAHVWTDGEAVTDWSLPDSHAAEGSARVLTPGFSLGGTSFDAWISGDVLAVDSPPDMGAVV